MKFFEMLGGILLIVFAISAIVFFVGFLTQNETLAAAGTIGGTSYYLGCCCVGLPLAAGIRFGLLK